MANGKMKNFMNITAFASVALIGVTLLLNFFGIGGNIFSTIGNCLAYIITAVVAWFYVKNKKNVWIYVIYFVSIVLILVAVILPLVGVTFGK